MPKSWDKKNNRNSPVVTVIPLSSQKTDEIYLRTTELNNNNIQKIKNFFDFSV